MATMLRSMVLSSDWTSLEFLFPGLYMSNGFVYFLTLCSIFGIIVLGEYLHVIQTAIIARELEIKQSEQYAISEDPESGVAANIEQDGVIDSSDSIPNVAASVSVTRAHFPMLLLVLHFCQKAIGFVLMVSLMTMDVGLVFMVLIGSTVGFYVVHRQQRRMPPSNVHH